MENQHPEALILVNDRPSAIGDDLYQWALDAEGMIRRLNARVEELEAMLDALGAGGVSAQRVTQAADHVAQPLEMLAAPGVLSEPNAWAAVYFSGKRAGKIYTTCDTKEQIEAYIHQVHQSDDSITLRAEPIYMRAAANGITQEKQG